MTQNCTVEKVEKIPGGAYVAVTVKGWRVSATVNVPVRQAKSYTIGRAVMVNIQLLAP